MVSKKLLILTDECQRFLLKLEKNNIFRKHKTLVATARKDSLVLRLLQSVLHLIASDDALINTEIILP